MTDKQIIIDGVDMNECEFLIINNDKHLCRCIKSDLFGAIEFVENVRKGNCKDNPNCYYKQLKRKEQECEEFRKANDEKNELLAKLGCPTIATARRKVFCLQEQLDQFKAEQNKIKTICDNHFDEYEMGCLDLSDAIESLLERYDNAITGLMKQRKELKADNDEFKTMLKDLSYENQKFCYQIEEQTKQLEPFKDEYFKSLDNVVIAGLAKKSIRITAENSKLEQALTEIKEIAEIINDRTMVASYICDHLDKILQKISECEINYEN